MAGQELEDPRPGEPSFARERDPYLSSFSLSSISKGPDLRIGLLLRGSHLTRASISVIDDIEASSFARIEMILLSPSAGQGSSDRHEPLRSTAPLHGRRSFACCLAGLRGAGPASRATSRRSTQRRGCVEPAPRYPGGPVRSVAARPPTRMPPSGPRRSTSSSTWAAPTRWTPIRATSSRSIAPVPSWPRTAHGRFASEIPHPSEAGRRTSRRSSRRHRSAPSPWTDSPILGPAGSRSPRPHFRPTADQLPATAYSHSTDRPIS